MPAYIIANVNITDPETYQEYMKLVPPTLDKFGGKPVVRGGHAENLEGEWQPSRVSILEFESFDRAMQWWNSEDYADAKAMRQRSSNTQMIVVEGT